MRVWKNPFISLPWTAFWLMVRHLKELAIAEKELQEALNGKRRR